MTDGTASGATTGQGTTTAAATTTAAGATTAAATTTAATATTSAAQHFYDSFKDADLKGWVAGKNWAELEPAFASHRNLEKMIGAPADEIVRLGKSPDEATIRSIQTRLGLPADAAKYELPTPEGLPVDQGFMDWARGAFHKSGLTASQAKDVVAAYNQFTTERLAQDAKDYDLNVNADIGKLRAEWGNGYDAQMARASRTREMLGIPDEAIDAMETAMGYGNVMRLFAGLSQKFSEDTFRDANSTARTGGFGMQMTPAEAKSELNRLFADKNFAAALNDRSHPQHKDAVAKKTQLVSMAS